MNYQKIDALLSEAINEEFLTDERDLIVFIRTTAPPDGKEIEELKRLGVKNAFAGGKIFTARISSRAASELSEKSWVRLLSLSQRLKPLD